MELQQIRSDWPFVKMILVNSQTFCAMFLVALAQCMVAVFRQISAGPDDALEAAARRSLPERKKLAASSFMELCIESLGEKDMG